MKTLKGGTDGNVVPDREKMIFEQYSVPRAVAAMVIPTVLSQIVNVIYNIADTWYVGLTENPAAIAAVSLCLPVYMMLTAIANLFGIGGSAVMARALGEGKKDRAGRVFSAAVLLALAAGIFYAVLIFCVRRPFLLLIGADGSDIGYAVTYVWYTVVLGGVPTILGAVFSHLIRATGAARVAGTGMAVGAVANIILDPLLMFVILPPGNELMGAALATCISNCMTFAVFLIYLVRRRKDGLLVLRLKRSEENEKVTKSIFKDGVPGFLMVCMPLVSNFFLNSAISAMGSEAVAGIGIVRKIDQLAFSVNQGVTQGMLPLIAYSYSSGRYKRMRSVVFFGGACTEIFSLICMAVSLIFAPVLIRIFIRDPLTVSFGASFLQVLCLAIPVYSLTFVINSFFQAIGYGMYSLVVSLIRRGTLDILLVLLIGKTAGPEYVIWGSPSTEVLGLAVAVVLFLYVNRKYRE